MDQRGKRAAGGGSGNDYRGSASPSYSFFPNDNEMDETPKYNNYILEQQGGLSRWADSTGRDDSALGTASIQDRYDDGLQSTRATESIAPDRYDQRSVFSHNDNFSHSPNMDDGSWGNATHSWPSEAKAKRGSPVRNSSLTSEVVEDSPQREAELESGLHAVQNRITQDEDVHGPNADSDVGDNAELDNFGTRSSSLGLDVRRNKIVEGQLYIDPARRTRNPPQGLQDFLDRVSSDARPYVDPPVVWKRFDHDDEGRTANTAIERYQRAADKFSMTSRRANWGSEGDNGSTAMFEMGGDSLLHQHRSPGAESRHSSDDVGRERDGFRPRPGLNFEVKSIDVKDDTGFEPSFTQNLMRRERDRSTEPQLPRILSKITDATMEMLDEPLNIRQMYTGPAYDLPIGSTFDSIPHPSWLRKDIEMSDAPELPPESSKRQREEDPAMEPPSKRSRSRSVTPEIGRGSSSQRPSPRTQRARGSTAPKNMGRRSPKETQPEDSAYDSLHLLDDTRRSPSQVVLKTNVGDMHEVEIPEDLEGRQPFRHASAEIAYSEVIPGWSGPPDTLRGRHAHSLSNEDDEALAPLLPRSASPASSAASASVEMTRCSYPQSGLNNASGGDGGSQTPSRTSHGSGSSPNASSSGSSGRPPRDGSTSNTSLSTPPSTNGTSATTQQAGSSPPSAPLPVETASLAGFFKSSSAILFFCLLLSLLGMFFQGASLATFFASSPQPNTGRFADPDFLTLCANFWIQSIGLCVSLFGIWRLKEAYLREWALLVGILSFVASVVGLGLYYLYTNLGDTLMTAASMFQVWIWMMIIFGRRAEGTFSDGESVVRTSSSASSGQFP